MKKQYIEPKLRVIEIDNASLIADSPAPDYGGDDGGSGTAEAKGNVWGWNWGWDEEW